MVKMGKASALTLFARVALIVGYLWTVSRRIPHASTVASHGQYYALVLLEANQLMLDAQGVLAVVDAAKDLQIVTRLGRTPLIQPSVHVLGMTPQNLRHSKRKMCPSHRGRSSTRSSRKLARTCSSTSASRTSSRGSRGGSARHRRARSTWSSRR